MSSRLLFTIATVAGLLGTYAVYAVVTRPFVVVPEIPEKPVDVAEHAMAHRPAENVRVAQSHLSELSWASESQYMMRSGQTFIYTQSFKPTPADGQIRFAPFAMVWLQKDKEGRETAVSLVSDSALVRFASGFDGMNPNPGRVIGAVLDGEVQLKGPDGLAMVGKQFIFDESAPSLISTNPVHFTYASHNGWGRTLHVKLIPAEGPPGRDRPHVYGVRTIRLGSGTNPATKKREPVRLDIRMPQQGQQKLVKVRCNGDLEYDVAAHTALFSQAVRAHSMTSATGYDALECDKLWLQFAPASRATPEVSPSPEGGQTEKPPFQKLETDLSFSRLIAEGQTVKIESTDRNLRATMTRLVYDADQRRLQLTHPREVYVSQRGSTLAVPEVDVRMREDNWPEEVLCRGAGRMEMIRPETNELALIASWAGQLNLTKSAPAVSGLDLIQLQRQASFLQPRQHTGLGADVIQLWLANAIDNPADHGKTSAGAAEKLPDPQPLRLFAERNVALVSPQLEAQAGELDVRFDADAAPQQTSNVSRDGLQLVVLEVPVAQTVAREPLRPQQQQKPKPKVALRDRGLQPINHATVARNRDSLGPPIEIPLTTGGDTATGKSRPVNSKQRSQEPLEVVADRIAVQMRRIEGKTEPELVEVETQGKVRIVQRRANGEPPLTAEGDRLRLQNRGLNREIVHLFGQPSHLRDRGLHVEGREVHLDRAANRVWVKGNGLLQLPVPPGTELESLGQTANDPDLDVWWEESMEFDGRTAKFIGKVRAELGLSRMQCEQMNVSLSSRLSFTQTQVDLQPELGTIHCREDVKFDSSAYEGTKLVQVQRGKVAEFTIDRLKGASFAQGPGQIQVWQRGKGQASGQRDVIQANRPINSVSTEWTFTRVDFKGRMIGKINERSSTFYDSVLIVHGPVERPGDTIDADHLSPLAGSMRCDELEFSHHSKGPNQPEDYQQLVGKGNARIEGRGFYANANEISYDGAKGLYMLRSHGNQSAMIAQDDDGRRNEASGRRIEFIPATKTVKVDWATGATGSR